MVKQTSGVPLTTPAQSTSPVNKRKPKDTANRTAPQAKKTKMTHSSTDKIEDVEEEAKAIYRRIDALESGKHSKRAISEYIQKVKLVIKHNPDAFQQEMLTYTLMLNDLTEKQRVMLERLLGSEDLYVANHQFPQSPSSADLKATWEDLHQHILDIVGPDHTAPTPELGQDGWSWHYLLTQIVSGRIVDAELDAHLQGLRDFLHSPHAQQALLSALFCRWLFQSPEPMFADEHPPSTVKHLNVIQHSGGMNRMANADKVNAQELFHCPDEQHRIVKPREHGLVKNLADVASSICQAHETPFSTTPEDMAAQSLKFKLSLMLSPKDYRVYFCQPNTPYDPAWMKAYNDRNEPVEDGEAVGKNITLCLFPALLAQDAEPFADDARFEDALVKNKIFFPTFSELQSIDPKQYVAKASVLML